LQGGNIVALAHFVGELAAGELIAMIPTGNKKVWLILSLAHATHLGIRDQQIEMSNEVGDFRFCLKNEIAWAKKNLCSVQPADLPDRAPEIRMKSRRQYLHSGTRIGASSVRSAHVNENTQRSVPV
jgi:hypothetical protein